MSKTYWCIFFLSMVLRGFCQISSSSSTDSTGTETFLGVAIPNETSTTTSNTADTFVTPTSTTTSTADTFPMTTDNADESITDRITHSIQERHAKVKPIVFILPIIFTYLGIVFLISAAFITVTCIVYWILLPRTYAFSAAFNPPFSQTIPRGTYVAAREMTD